MHALLDIARALASQVDPKLGTSEAQQGAIQRMSEPNSYDVVFPVIAFLLVIVAPAVTALWVIFRTATDKTKEADET
ncbi:MAG: hypothetical protein HYS27_08770 [Deltaproteobacteria bacterium]|nr:hypothetical protein [Deltaproteobacteria bacterium]